MWFFCEKCLFNFKYFFLVCRWTYTPSKSRSKNNFFDDNVITSDIYVQFHNLVFLESAKINFGGSRGCLGDDGFCMVFSWQIFIIMLIHFIVGIILIFFLCRALSLSLWSMVLFKFLEIKSLIKHLLKYIQ